MDRLKLIAEVKKRPYLWKRQNRRKSFKLSHHLWQEVAANLGIDEKTCQRNWRNLSLRYLAWKKRSEEKIAWLKENEIYNPDIHHRTEFVLYDFLKFLDANEESDLRDAEDNHIQMEIVDENATTSSKISSKQENIKYIYEIRESEFGSNLRKHSDLRQITALQKEESKSIKNEPIVLMSADKDDRTKNADVAETKDSENECNNAAYDICVKEDPEIQISTKLDFQQQNVVEVCIKKETESDIKIQPQKLDNICIKQEAVVRIPSIEKDQLQYVTDTECGVDIQYDIDIQSQRESELHLNNPTFSTYVKKTTELQISSPSNIQPQNVQSLCIKEEPEFTDILIPPSQLNNVFTKTEPEERTYSQQYDQLIVNKTTKVDNHDNYNCKVSNTPAQNLPQVAIKVESSSESEPEREAQMFSDANDQIQYFRDISLTDIKIETEDSDRDLQSEEGSQPTNSAFDACVKEKPEVQISSQLNAQSKNVETVCIKEEPEFSDMLIPSSQQNDQRKGIVNRTTKESSKKSCNYKVPNANAQNLPPVAFKVEPNGDVESENDDPHFSETSDQLLYLSDTSLTDIEFEIEDSDQDIQSENEHGEQRINSALNACVQEQPEVQISSQLNVQSKNVETVCIKEEPEFSDMLIPSSQQNDQRKGIVNRTTKDSSKNSCSYKVPNANAQNLLPVAIKVETNSDMESECEDQHFSETIDQLQYFSDTSLTDIEVEIEDSDQDIQSENEHEQQRINSALNTCAQEQPEVKISSHLNGQPKNGESVCIKEEPEFSDILISSSQRNDQRKGIVNRTTKDSGKNSCNYKVPNANAQNLPPVAIKVEPNSDMEPEIEDQHFSETIDQLQYFSDTSLTDIEVEIEDSDLDIKSETEHGQQRINSASNTCVQEQPEVKISSHLNGQPKNGESLFIKEEPEFSDILISSSQRNDQRKGIVNRTIKESSKNSCNYKVPNANVQNLPPVAIKDEPNSDIESESEDQHFSETIDQLQYFSDASLTDIEVEIEDSDLDIQSENGQQRINSALNACVQEKSEVPFSSQLNAEPKNGESVCIKEEPEFSDIFIPSPQFKKIFKEDNEDSNNVPKINARNLTQVASKIEKNSDAKSRTSVLNDGDSGRDIEMRYEKEFDHPKDPAPIRKEDIPQPHPLIPQKCTKRKRGKENSYDQIYNAAGPKHNREVITYSDSTRAGDADYFFLCGCLPTMKMMTKSQNSEFRAKIMNLMLDILPEDGGS